MAPRRHPVGRSPRRADRALPHPRHRRGRHAAGGARTSGHDHLALSPGVASGRPGQRPLVQDLRVRAGGQRLGWLPAPPGQRPPVLLQPRLADGVIARQQKTGGIDLVYVLGAGKHQPALQLPPDRGAVQLHPGMCWSVFPRAERAARPGLAGGAAARFAQCPRHRHGHRRPPESDQYGLPGGSRQRSQDAATTAAAQHPARVATTTGCRPRPPIVDLLNRSVGGGARRLGPDSAMGTDHRGRGRGGAGCTGPPEGVGLVGVALDVLCPSHAAAWTLLVRPIGLMECGAAVGCDQPRKFRTMELSLI